MITFKNIARLILYIFALMLFMVQACKTRYPVYEKPPVVKENEKSDFYKDYSKKLGVNLQGTENKKLIISMAEWLGVPYKYGGESRQGTDCSGMVMTIYKEVYNKDLFRSSNEQVKNVKLIKREELTTGDLVFFKISGNKVSHVGIYIGENKFIHSTTQSGVVISSLEEPYYKKSFFSGGRVAVN